MIQCPHCKKGSLQKIPDEAELLCHLCGEWTGLVNYELPRFTADDMQRFGWFVESTKNRDIPQLFINWMLETVEYLELEDLE